MTIYQEPTETLLDQAAGCLIGLACGDALGGPVEGMDSGEIAGRYGYLDQMVGGGHLGLEPGETTDDTAQALALAESIVDAGGLDPDDVAMRLASWYRFRPKGIGSHTTAVLDRIAALEDWEQASLEVQAANPSSAGNGSLMRCAPVALLDYGSMSTLIEDSRVSSRITHPHAECQWSCALNNLVIAELLAGAQPQHAVDNALATCAHRGDVASNVLDRAKRAALSASENTLTPSGYVLDTLECSIWALLRHDGFEDAVTAVVNLGGDADTNGAVTGALAGAAFGFDAIPERWLLHIAGWQHMQELATALVGIH